MFSDQIRMGKRECTAAGALLSASFVTGGSLETTAEPRGATCFREITRGLIGEGGPRCETL